MVLILEVPVASIAIIIIAVSWKTIRAIKHLSVGKSFWVPVLASGIFFLAGSTMAILSDLGFSFTIYTAEAMVGSRLFGLCFLAGGVYTYSRKIKKTLVEQLILPEQLVAKEYNEETEANSSIIERFEEKAPEQNIDCKHQLGYLRSLPRRAPLPEECSGCHQIIDCKFSIVKKAKTGSPKASTPNPDVWISDVSTEEEVPNRSN